MERRFQVGRYKGNCSLSRIDDRAGFAWVTSQGAGVQSVDVVTDWPGNAAGYLQKVPSQIAYRVDNEKLDKDVWGYEIPATAKKHCWTKLLLDKKAQATRHDDPTLSGFSAQPMLNDKSPSDVVADFLSCLYKHCMAHLEKKMTAGVLRVTPIEFWFTMPAIWSDEAQYATKAAAEKAGFGSGPQREQDSINMITEPEAAALSALKLTADKYDDLLEVSCLCLCNATLWKLTI